MGNPIAYNASAPQQYHRASYALSPVLTKEKEGSGVGLYARSNIESSENYVHFSSILLCGGGRDRPAPRRIYF